MYDIICIGSAGQDIFFPLDDVEIYNTPEDLMAQKHMLLEFGAKYRVANRYEAPGGGAINAAMGLARLGLKSAPHAVLGDDSFADSIEGMLDKEKISRSGLRRIPGAKTDVSCVLVDTRSADRTIVYNRDTNERFRVKESFLEKSGALFVSGLSGPWKENLDIVLRVARKFHKRLFYNPGQKDISRHTEEVMEVIGMCEGLFVNKDEAIEIVMRGLGGVGKDEVQDESYLLKALSDAGAKSVALTDGASGAWAFDGRQLVFARANGACAAVDSTGAGDAFTGAFLSGYLQGQDTITCLKRGIANGSSVVEHYGAMEGLLRSQEIVPLASRVEAKILNGE